MRTRMLMASLVAMGLAALQPLTALSEDERLFQATIRRFARDEIRPYVSNRRHTLKRVI